MKTLILLLALPFAGIMGTLNWMTDFEQAKSVAKEKDEYILVSFSGSDWCSGCIKMEGEIFESSSFQQYAPDHLILLKADFPRLKKNQLSKEQQAKNDALAEQYNPDGYFPFTVLLDKNGKAVRSWEGYFDQGATRFIAELKESHAHQ